MELVYRITLFIAGIINLLPSMLAFLPHKMVQSYGITAPDSNYELLLRHRAVLFGIVGALLIFSAITKKQYGIATTIGLISMISFIVLYFLVQKDISEELKKVMLIDVVATIILLIGALLYAISSKGFQ